MSDDKDTEAKEPSPEESDELDEREPEGGESVVGDDAAGASTTEADEADEAEGDDRDAGADTVADAPAEEKEGDEEEGEEEGEDDVYPFGPDPLASADDEIDPELLALGEQKPAPKLYRGLVMAAVCVVVLIMMFWFRLELLYFFSPSEPIDLGDADSATIGEETANRYVRFDGVPLAPRSVNPSVRCGRMQGFPTYQKRFLCRGHLSAIPLMGRPEHDLVVQRYLVRQLRVSFFLPEENRQALLDEALGTVRGVRGVHRARLSEPYEIGQIMVEVQGRTGQTSTAGVIRSIRFHLESAVAGIRSINVEAVNRDAPGSFVGRAVRIADLGSRFAAVDAYLDECTDYSLSDDAMVVLDGSEAGDGLFGAGAMCYGQSPRQYWPYLVLYIALVAVFVLNMVLFVRFVRAWLSER